MVRRIIKNAREKILSQYTLEHMAEATIKVYEEVIQHINILVIKLSALGDIILATPSLKALKKTFPLSKIYCLIKKDFREALQLCPYLEDLIIYDPEHKHKSGWWGIWRLSKKLRGFQFDKVIDFQNNYKSHMLSFLSFCPERYGYRNQKWGCLLNDGIKDLDKSVDPVTHQFRILNLLGIEPTGKERLELWSSSKDRIYIEQILESQWIADNTILVGIQLSASGRWQSKAWPLDYIAQLCDLLAVKNIRVVLTGSRSDQGAARQLLKLTNAKPADLTGKTSIAQLFALLKKCHTFVAMDSAPLHVAAAANVPVIALFGPTDPARHMPPIEKGRVLYRPVSCSPCYSPTCLIKTHECLRQIKPLEVAQVVEEMIASNS
jgi:lipopolysaccharide heptosyltransferase II